MAVFAGVALMVVIGQRFGKPMEVEQQSKYSKVIWILVFVMLVSALIKEMMF
jgi:hypothetical protein